MASEVIENEIVKLSLDKEDFSKNIQESIKSIQDLRTSIDQANSGQALTVLQNSVDRLNDRFSALGIAGMTAIQNITNKVIGLATQMSRSFSNNFLKGPFDQGWGEYELKMGSVQTIMASTGESLETINTKLDELNTYADKTIYSFSDMTSNIGKFTNAGVDLDTAVKAIQGISNAAALAGANSNEASRAMYNFAQALSMGSVQLVDWKSIENANMATKEFKQTLIDAAVDVGTLTAEGDKFVSTTKNANGEVSQAFDAIEGFRNSLNYQWMTTEVLTKALSRYSDETDTIGKRAYAAAQDVKTFSQLLATIKEAIGSGWAKTFEIVVGDFEEAKELFTSISKVVGGFVDRVSDARNNLLEAALGPGLEGEFLSAGNAIEDTKSKLEEYEKIAKEVESGAWGNGQARIDKLTEAGYNYDAVMMLVNRDLISAEFNVDKWTEAVGAATGATEELTAANSKTGRELLIESFANVAKSAIKIFQTLGEAYRKVFPPVTAQTLRDLIEKFHAFSEQLIISRGAVFQLGQIFRGVFSLIRTVGDVVGGLGRAIIPTVVKGVVGLTKAFITVVEPIATYVSVISDAIHETDMFYNIFNAIRAIGYNFFYNLAEGVKSVLNIFGVTLPKMSDYRQALDDIANHITDFVKSLNVGPVVNWFRKAFSKIPVVFTAVAKAIKFAAGAVKNFFDLFKAPSADEAEKKLTIFQKIGNVIRSVISKLSSIGGKFTSGVKNFFAIFVSSAANETERKINLFSKIGNVIATAAKKIISVLKNVGNAVKGLFDKVKNSEQFKKVVSTVTSAFSDLSRRVKDWYSSLDGTDILSKFSSAFSKYLLPRLKEAGEALTKFGSKAKSVFSTFGNKVLKPAAQNVQEWYKSLEGDTPLEKLRAVFDRSIFATIPEMLSKAKEKVIEFYKSLGDGSALDKLKRLPSVLKDLASSFDFSGAWSKFKEGFTKNVIEPLSNFNLFERVKQAIIDFKDKLQDMHPLEAFKEAFTKYVLEPLTNNPVTNGVSNIVDKIKESFTNLHDFFVNFSIMDIPAVKKLADLFPGLQSGVEKLSKVGEKLAGAKDLVRVLTDIIKTYSSVKLFKKIGQAFGQLGGVFETFGTVLQGIGGSIGGTFGAISSFFIDLKDGLQTFKEVIKGYSKEMKANALLKTVGAITLFIGVMVALSFVPVENIKRGLFEIVSALGALLIFSALFNKVNKNGNSLLDVGKGVLAIAGAMLIMQYAIKKFGKMDLAVMGKGILAVVVLFGILKSFMKKTSGIDQTGTSWKTILAFAASMLILQKAVEKLGAMDIPTLAKGIIATWALLKILGKQAEKISKLGKVGATMLALSVSMIIMQKAVEKLGAMDLWSLIKGVGAIQLVLDSMSGIVNKQTSIRNAIATIAMIGGSLYIITYFIERLSKLPVEQSVGISLGLGVLIGAIGEALGKVGNMSFGSIIKAALGIVLTAVLAIVAIFAVFAGAGYLIGKFMSDDTKQTILGGLETLKEIGIKIGEIVGGLIGGVFAGIGEQLPGIATNLSTFMTNLKGFLDGAGSITESQKTGIGTLMDMIKDLTVAEVWDAASQLILKWAGKENRDMLQSYAEGLEQFGQSLIKFDYYMSQLNIDRVDTGVTFLERVGTMATSIKSTDDIISTLFGGREDLGSFGEELTALGRCMIDFSMQMFLVNTANMEKGATAAQALADVANNLPEESVLGKLITGNRESWTKFAEGLPNLGAGMIGLSDAINNSESELDPAAIQKVADAAIPLANLANAMPKTSVFKRLVTGVNMGWDTFSTGMADFGTALKDFTVNTEGLKYHSGCKAAISLSDDLTKILKDMPSSGGYWQDWFGEKKWSTVSDGLPDLGKALTSFRDNVAGLEYDGGQRTQDGTSSAVLLARDLTDLANELPAEGGIMQSIFGSQNLGLFGQNIESFSEALNTFCTNSASTNFDDGQKSLDFVQSMIDLAEKIKGDGDTSTMTDSLWSFVTSMGNVATDAREKFTKGIKPIESEIQDVLDEYEKQVITNGLGSTDMQDKFHDAGYELVTKFNGGINDKIPDVKNRVNTDIITTAITAINSRKWEFSAAGRIVIGEFIDGMGSRGQNARNAAYRIGNNAAYGLNDSRGGAYNAGRNVAYGFADGMYSLFNYVYNTAYNMGISAVNGARRALRVMSPSRVFMQIGEYTGEGLVIGMQDQYGSVEDASAGMGKTALDSMAEMMNRVKMLLDGTDEFNPTITPVLDLSKIQQGVGQIDGMFNTPHLAIPGTKVLGDLNTTSANIDIKDQIRQGVLEAFNSMPNAATNETNNIYINGADSDPNEIADAVIDKLNLRYNQRRAVFG